MTQSDSSSKTLLPARPSLQLLSNLAKQLRKAHSEGDAGAIDRFQRHHPRFTSWPSEQIAKTAMSLRDAQLVIAREYGFEHWAAMKVHEELIARGASVHLKVDSSNFGTKAFTPLHSAAWTGNLDAIRVLVKHGAELGARDGTYKATPAEWADYAGRKEAAELLRSLGG